MSNKEYLLIDSCLNSGFELELLSESSENNRGLTKFRGKFQEAEAVNKNKRMYPFSVLDESIKQLQSAMEDRRLVGELDHPTDSILHFEKASHVITKLWWEGNTMMGEGEILSTPCGAVLKALLNDGVKIGISSRGVGNGTTNEDGILVIGESYKLLTFDVVADPSCYEAFQEKIVTKEAVVDQIGQWQRADQAPRMGADSQATQNTTNSVVKNEHSRIDTVSKETLIACIGGIVKSQENEIKSRLG
jgi:hypothetical protein